VQDHIRFRPQGLQGILPEAKMVFRVQQSAEPTEHADAALQLARTFREGQIQARLRPFWSRTFKCRLLPGRGPFWFSDYEYREIEILVPEHPEALPIEADPYDIIRPEGARGIPGVLDASAERGPGQDEPA
jgi:hypothetical protein